MQCHYHILLIYVNLSLCLPLMSYEPFFHLNLMHDLFCSQWANWPNCRIHCGGRLALRCPQQILQVPLIISRVNVIAI